MDNDVIPFAKQPDAVVFYWNIKGDYMRYICEVETGDRRSSAIQQAKSFYESGWALAENEVTLHNMGA